MTYELHRHDARNVSTLLDPESVDLIVTSPPYFGLRSYRDECDACGGDGWARPGVEAKPPPRVTPNNNGLGSSTLTGGVQMRPQAPTTDGGCPVCNGTGRSHYDGQIGSEPTPTEFLDALIACTADWVRVLKPTGSLWVNLGDKYSGAQAQNYGGESRAGDAAAVWARTDPRRTGIPAKSLMGIPWRYAIRCVDELGLILRAEVVWSKPNGLPEPVTDRVRRSHEQWFHFTRRGRYFAAIDEVREAHTGPPVEHFGTVTQAAADKLKRLTDGLARTSIVQPQPRDYNPLGKAPGSVWQIPSEPLVVPDDLGVDHFAAFPSEWPRRIVLGWSPTGYCTVCGEARRAVVDGENHILRSGDYPTQEGRSGGSLVATTRKASTSTITGYACACPTIGDPCPRCVGTGRYAIDPCTDCDGTGLYDIAPLPPTRPAVVLDPFCGTGTTPAVAHLLGRHGIGVDLSADYLRLAEWRCTSDRRLRDKVLDRTGIPNPDPPAVDGQLDLFAEGVG